MLKSILDMEPDVIRKANDFLRQAFIDLSDHSEFDEEFYRKQWKNQLYDLKEVSIPFEGYSEEEIKLSLEIAIKVLEKNKASRLAEKEVKSA